ncbi:MAG: hypothetical protein J6T08_06195, partial [Lentisphaeria bacterium]|nr:hypothetical protein [Lentisphaeria bacterium]
EGKVVEVELGESDPAPIVQFLTGNVLEGCGMEEAKAYLGDKATCEEDVLSYIAFPTQAEAFFEKREADRKNTFTYTITRID